MKHQSTRAVFDYWNKKRGVRPAPARAEINPTEIRAALGDTFMLAADFSNQLRLRLAGTRVCALFGREIKSEIFGELFGETSRRSIDELIGVVTHEATGIVAGLIGETEDGAKTDLELLLLPLAHIGHVRVRAIGVLVPTLPPYWLGAKPVTALELVTLRHTGVDADTSIVPRIAAAPAGSRVRHGFVVYSGGLEMPSSKGTG